MRTSRLIVGLALIAVAVLLLIFGEGNYSTAGIIVFLIVGLTTIAISRRGKEDSG